MGAIHLITPPSAEALDERDRDVASRFLAKCSIDGECWRWVAYIDRTGCGRFWFGGWMDLAHRVSYRLFVGVIPEKWVVAQTCRNRWCVNPDHLSVAAKRRVRQPGGRRPWAPVYSTPEWKQARATVLDRDERRCTVAWLLGGECLGALHVHHVVPLAEGGAPYDLMNLGTTCARHHRAWEELRRRVMQDDEPEQPRCSHYHRSAEGRRQCEARLARAQRTAA